MLFFWLTLRQYINERGNANVQPSEGSFFCDFPPMRIENERENIDVL